MKKKQLSYEERIQIEQLLNEGEKISHIGLKLERPTGTISNEIQRNRIMKKPNTYGRKSFHFCENKETCLLKFDAMNCHNRCPNYKERICPQLTRPPYVCNACQNKRKCYLRKFYYQGKDANQEAIRVRKERHQKISITPDKLQALDELITPLIQKGQPLLHIYETHQEEIPVSLRTLYDYIDLGYLSIKNIDLRRKVRYKPRQSKRKSTKSTVNRTNRTYKDFLRYLASDKNLTVVEMDTVEGKKGEKPCLLTLFFRQTHLMIIRLLEEQTSRAVLKELDLIQDQLSLPEFADLFPLILTDNGSEFSQPDELEALDGEFFRTKVFYCDPNRSDQKGAIEKNHEFIRYVLPKGTSFRDLTPENVALLSSHINSTVRVALGGKTPYETSEFLWVNGTERLDALGIKKIEHDELILNQDLLD